MICLVIFEVFIPTLSLVLHEKYEIYDFFLRLPWPVIVLFKIDLILSLSSDHLGIEFFGIRPMNVLFIIYFYFDTGSDSFCDIYNDMYLS